mmetsp:Transcript_26722/g.58578  ORF Transcript_26722/g.58578 Transcript_26722/m.58578 type:complete len:258 (-) Transcript_26722:1313-2086(-)
MQHAIYTLFDFWCSHFCTRFLGKCGIHGVRCVGAYRAPSIHALRLVAGSTTCVARLLALVENNKGATRHRRISDPSEDSRQHPNTRKVTQKLGNDRFQELDRANDDGIKVGHGSDVSHRSNQVADQHHHQFQRESIESVPHQKSPESVAGIAIPGDFLSQYRQLENEHHHGTDRHGQKHKDAEGHVCSRCFCHRNVTNPPNRAGDGQQVSDESCSESSRVDVAVVHRIRGIPRTKDRPGKGYHGAGEFQHRHVRTGA